MNYSSSQLPSRHYFFLFIYPLISSCLIPYHCSLLSSHILSWRLNHLSFSFYMLPRFLSLPLSLLFPLIRSLSLSIYLYVSLPLSLLFSLIRSLSLFLSLSLSLPIHPSLSFSLPFASFIIYFFLIHSFFFPFPPTFLFFLRNPFLMFDVASQTFGDSMKTSQSRIPSTNDPNYLDRLILDTRVKSFTFLSFWYLFFFLLFSCGCLMNSLFLCFYYLFFFFSSPFLSSFFFLFSLSIIFGLSFFLFFFLTPFLSLWLLFFLSCLLLYLSIYLSLSLSNSIILLHSALLSKSPPIPIFTFVLQLPEDPLFSPALEIKCYDSRMGSNIILGTSK